MEQTVFLAADTARSQAYAQAMAASALAPVQTILFGAGTKGLPGQGNPQASRMKGLPEVLHIPDLSESLQQTCQRAAWLTHELTATDVNSSEVVATLKAFSSQLTIYSGYGGQILKPAVLRAGVRILHIHGGWLPGYRGSTTLYYSWLLENRIGASAILMEESIDTGPIVARRHYPPPPSGLEVDYLYDSAIRADLLVAVLKDYAETGKLPALTPQAGSLTKATPQVHFPSGADACSK